MKNDTLFSLKPYEITHISEIASGVFTIRFNRDFYFIPGQVVACDSVATGNPRLYSIASGPAQDYVEIVFDKKPVGYLTPKLAACKKGDMIFVSAPRGSFFGTLETAWWIATGTGIAPFKSMLDAGMGLNKKAIHGGRSPSSFYYSQDFFDKLGSNYIRCSSTSNDPEFYKGRLTEYLMSFAVLLPDCWYFLCGSAEMVVQVRDILLLKGVPYPRIIAETYF